jgi:hypothetical protein
MILFHTIDFRTLLNLKEKQIYRCQMKPKKQDEERMETNLGEFIKSN